MNIDNNGTETKFSIELLRKDDETVCVDFKKIEGCSIDYFNIVESVKKIIANIW